MVEEENRYSGDRCWREKHTKIKLSKNSTNWTEVRGKTDTVHLQFGIVLRGRRRGVKQETAS